MCVDVDDGDGGYGYPMCVILHVNMWIIKILLLLFFCCCFLISSLFSIFRATQHNKILQEKNEAAKKEGREKTKQKTKTIHGTICLFGIIGFKWSLALPKKLKFLTRSLYVSVCFSIVRPLHVSSDKMFTFRCLGFVG